MSPNFERLRKVLLLEGEPDRVPLIELWIEREVKEAFLGKPMSGEILDEDPSYRVEEDVEFWHRAGYDYIHVVPLYKFPKVEHALTDARLGAGTTEAGERLWVSEGKGLIMDFASFDRYPWEQVAKIDYSRLEEVGRHLPEGMGVISGSLAGIYEETWMIMGFERFALGVARDEELVRRVVDRVGEILVSIFERVVRYPWVKALWLSDDIAYTEGTIVSPHWLRKNLFPWYERISSVARSRGLPMLYHSDGRLWEVLDDLVALGFNALHPIEPKAMDLGELKRRYGHKLCLLGGVDLDFPLTRGRPKDVREAVRRILRDIAPGGGYAIGSSNSIASWVPLENYRALIDATLEFGRYPIT